jgi:hypothetical protein
MNPSRGRGAIVALLIWAALVGVVLFAIAPAALRLDLPVYGRDTIRLTQTSPC